MRKVILFIANSLDGYIARNDGGIDWLYTDNDYGYKEFYDSIDTTLSGYGTYHKILEFEEFPYTGKTNYVFSRSHTQPAVPEHPVTMVNTDPVAFTRGLKQKEGEHIWLVGGGQINTLLLDAGLIDEMVISTHPVILGDGIPMFHGKPKESWYHPVNTRVFQSGLVQVRYLKANVPI